MENVGEGFIPSRRSTTGTAMPGSRDIRFATAGGDKPRPYERQKKAIPIGTYF